jgi:hypothetical protein
MLWIAVVTVCAGVVALLVVLLVKRPSDVDQLGAVSTHWITEHRVDEP